MLRSPLKPLSSAALLFLLCCSPARAVNLMENHPGLAVEWIYPTDGPATDFVLGDADGDNDLDLFVVVNNALQLWLNDGRRGFTVQQTSICIFPVAGILAMDVDGDSRVDVVARRCWSRFTGHAEDCGDSVRAHIGFRPARAGTDGVHGGGIAASRDASVRNRRRRYEPG